MTFRRTRCPHCKGKLEPGQRIHPECIEGYAQAQEQKARRKAEKQARMQARVEKAETRRKLEAIKTIPQLIKEAQREFNAYIRARDVEKGCISCGAPLVVGDAAGNFSGGDFDCGHYRSVGSAGHLRFDSDNAHGQCKHCNRWLSGGVVNYRIGLLGRIGRVRLEALEANNAPHKWTHEELRAIRDEYRQKRKQFK